MPLRVVISLGEPRTPVTCCATAVVTFQKAARTSTTCLKRPNLMFRYHMTTDLPRVSWGFSHFIERYEPECERILPVNRAVRCHL